MHCEYRPLSIAHSTLLFLLNTANRYLDGSGKRALFFCSGSWLDLPDDESQDIYDDEVQEGAYMMTEGLI